MTEMQAPEMRNIAIGFVVHRPATPLLSRLALALDSGFSLYIFDNSPADGSTREMCRSHERCRYATCGKNVGLGFGIAAVCAQAYYDGFAALLFFDQDTVFTSSTLGFIEEFTARNPQLPQQYSAIVFNATRAAEANPPDPWAIRDVLLAISSGSLFYLENLKRINWHNPDYFVDCVDYEFCLNSHRRHLKIGECATAPGFDHVSEQADVPYVVWGKTRRLRRYPARRIIQTAWASVRLAFSALASGCAAFFLAMVRSLANYLFWQLTVRVLETTGWGTIKK